MRPIHIYKTLILCAFMLAACSQAPTPGEDALPGLAPLILGSSATDTAHDLARHSSGVYVVGYSEGNLYATNKGENDAFISKYDTNGAVLWGKQFGTSSSDTAAGVASDGSNNAYVFGYTKGNLAGSRGGYDVFLRKYNASGGVSWTRQFGISASDLPGGVATYGSNVVYVVGNTDGSLAGSSGNTDGFIRKYSASGSIVWTRQFGTFQDDTVSDVAVDGSGNAYVVGTTTGSLGAANGGGYDMFIRRYNASGSVAWTKQLHRSRLDSATAVAVTGSSVYLLGQFTFNDAASTDLDVRVVKYTTSGTEVWNYWYGPSSNEFAGDISADSSGVVFSGETDGAFSGTNQGERDGFVYKVNSNGGYLWVRQQGSSRYDGTNAVLLRSGQVYAAGDTTGVLGATNHGGYDAFLRRMSGTTGATVWTDQ